MAEVEKEIQVTVTLFAEFKGVRYDVGTVDIPIKIHVNEPET